MPDTAICAAPGSELVVTHLTDSPDLSTYLLSPRTPLRALGATFGVGSSVDVLVQRSKSPNLHVTSIKLRGRLASPQILSGAMASGEVAIAQVGAESPQLVEASLAAGPFSAFGEPVEIAGPTTLAGSPEGLNLVGAGQILIRSIQFPMGPVEIRRDHPNELRLIGLLDRPQVVSSVHVSGAIDAAFSPSGVTLREAAVEAPTPLERFGLPPGEVPAGTTVRSSGSIVSVVAPGPISVCGIGLRGYATKNGAQLQFHLVGGTLEVYGDLVAPTAAVSGGTGGVPYLTGAVMLRMLPGRCDQLALTGRLGPDQHLGALALRAGSNFETQLRDGMQTIKSTLAAPTSIDGRRWSGQLTLVRDGDQVRVEEGTLAAAATLASWKLPAGTEVFDDGDRFSFATPRGRDARAFASFRGLSIDYVTNARAHRVANKLADFTLSAAITLPGTQLRVTELSLLPTGCLFGQSPTAQRHGPFRLPAKFGVQVCGKTVVEATSRSGVASVRFGRYWATSVIAGGPDDVYDDKSLRGRDVPTTPQPGFWLQINDLQNPNPCLAAPFLPQERWIYVEAAGRALADHPDDARALEHDATKPGKAQPPIDCDRVNIDFTP